MKRWTLRDAVALGTLFVLAALFATWPAAGIGAAIGAVACAAAAAVILVRPGKLVLAPLALGAAATALLPATLTEWRVWALALVAVVLLDALRNGGRDARRALIASAFVAAALVALAVLASAWRPTKDALIGGEGTATAVIVTGAIGAVLIVLLRGEEDADAVGP
ncbi:MAG: hypothetical protein ACYDCK_00880 [Thermoplasmatota archaeon]